MLRRSDLAFLSRDIAAGVTLGAVMVPVGLAFGSPAGAPLAGLYAGILPLIAYALIGSSRQLIIGPDASMAALVAVSVAPLADGDVAPEGRARRHAGGADRPGLHRRRCCGWASRRPFYPSVGAAVAAVT